ncbi:MAG: PD40 domain-containing protein [Gemmatimonadaceae bacterium]|nr:PD40 domain-containing protein [Gemmatimonadaceae bacterium]
MRTPLSFPTPFLIATAVAFLMPGSFSAQRPAAAGDSSSTRATWDVTKARGTTRDIDFTTSEGTWMSVDLSPDGRWVVFDLLGHIYRMPAAGGSATVLTQNSGVALNFQPRISPDGKSIAFITDRRGQYNLWLMNADGSNPRPVFSDLSATAFEPAWTPDGEFIVVRKGSRGAGAGGPAPAAGLWMYHKDGGSGVSLVTAGSGGTNSTPSWPSISADGKYLYYHVGMTVDDRQPLSGSLQLRRFTFRDGETLDLTAGETSSAAAGRFSSGGAAAPEISPDGRWLAFARQIPDGTLNFKGHEFGPRAALWLRDLQTGAERLLMDPVEPLAGSGGKTLGVLPRYKWAADGASIVIAQGGKLRRVTIGTREVATIPFTATVHRTISQMARNEFRISDDDIQAKFFRWPSSSANGASIAFQAVGRVYVQPAAGGTPRRLTPPSFSPLEFAPAWSPDGRSIAFVTWDDTGRGHVYRMPAAGGTPQRVTRHPGDYTDPTWSADGRSILVARGEGATARQRTMTHNVWFDVMRLDAGVSPTGDSGIVLAVINRPSGMSISGEARRQLPRVSVGPDGRIFWPEERTGSGTGPGARGGTALISVRPDGSDRQEHVNFPAADDILPSPGGRWVAFQEGDNVYVAPIAPGGIGSQVQRVDKRRSAFPARQLTRDGGLFPRWRNDSTLEYGSGAAFYVHHLAAGRTDTLRLKLSVPRAVPTGSVALTGARLLTMDKRAVIEQGTVVVRGSRIACVGSCSTAGVDRVIDARGTTIMPGLVDMHSHHYREWRGMRPKHDFEQAIYLAYGVTTTLDVSMYSQNMFPTAELIEAGEIVGPRGFSTGDNITAGDAARANEINNPADAMAMVRKMADWGATAVKQYAQPRRDQRQWMAEAARTVGVNETSEGGFFFENLGFIMDGQTGWEHAFSELPMYSDGAKFLGKAGATYSPTLVVAGPGAWNIEYWFQESDVWKDPKQRKWFPWRALMPHTRVRSQRPVTDFSYPIVAQAMADVIAEGGWGAMGSHGEHHGLAPHWEVWMGASALGSMGALEVATLHGARFLGADKDLGSLEVGKLADLVVLNSNPLDNIRNTTDARSVMKGGVLYDAMSLDQVWPRAIPFGPTYWVNDDALQMNSKGVDTFDRPKRP